MNRLAKAAEAIILVLLGDPPFFLPRPSVRQVAFELNPGKCRLDLSSSHGIVSFKLERTDVSADF